MQDLIVTLRGKDDVQRLREFTTIQWESTLLNVVAVRCAPEEVERVRQTPGVLNVEIPRVGRVMV